MVGGKLNSNIGVKPFFCLCYLEFLIIIIFLIEISKKMFLKMELLLLQGQRKAKEENEDSMLADRMWSLLVGF
jgi:hypothetical protein